MIVFQLISIGMCLFATAANIYWTTRAIRDARTFNKLADEYFKKYLELVEKEQGIELFDKDSRQ